MKDDEREAGHLLALPLHGADRLEVLQASEVCDLRLSSRSENDHAWAALPNGVLVMNEAILGAAIQGGIGVVALVIMATVLKSQLTSLRADLRSLNESLIQVSLRLGQLIGRDDPTPVRHAKEDFLERKAATARRSFKDDDNGKS